MSYQLTGDAVDDARFHRRARGCVIALAADILAATQDSGSIQDDALADLTTLACKNWSKNYLTGAAAATDRVIAGYLLLNGTIAADPFGDSTGNDAAMQWQLKHTLLTIVAMG